MEYCIQPIKAYLTRNTESLSSMDPYLVLEVGRQTFRTTTKQEGGRKPQWTDSFVLQAQPNEQVKVKVYDEDVTVDALVGEAEVNLASFEGVEERFVSLKFEGKPAGKVLLKVKRKGKDMLRQYSGQGFNKNLMYGSNGTKPEMFRSSPPLHPTSLNTPVYTLNNNLHLTGQTSRTLNYMPPPFNPTSSYKKPKYRITYSQSHTSRELTNNFTQGSIPRK